MTVMYRTTLSELEPVTPEWSVAAVNSMLAQQPQIGSPEMSQTHIVVSTSLGSTTRHPMTARPRLAMGEPGVGVTPLTANMMESYTTNVLTELNTPDIKLEDMVDTPFQYCSDPNKLVGSLSDQSGGMAMDREEEDVASSSSHHFSNFSTTQYVDMSPSTLDDLQECIMEESGGREDAVCQAAGNLMDSEIPISLFEELDNILKNAPLDNMLNSSSIDMRLMETGYSPMLSGTSNQHLATVPAISDSAMISQTNEQEHYVTDRILRPSSPPSISMSEEFEMPPEIQEIFETYERSMPLGNEPLDVSDANHVDLKIGEMDGPLFPTNCQDGDLLNQVLLQCKINTEENTTQPTHHVMMEQGEVLLPEEGGCTNWSPDQSSLPLATTPIFLPAPSVVGQIPATSVKTINLNGTQSVVIPVTSGKTNNLNGTRSVIVSSVATDSRSSSGQWPSTRMSQNAAPVVPLVQHSGVSNVDQIRVTRVKRATKRPLRLRDDDVILLDEGSAAGHRASSFIPEASIPSVGNPVTSSEDEYDSRISSANLDSSHPEGVPSTSSGRRRARRQPSRALTDEQKYRRTRELNNEASKRCREKRKGKLSGLEEEEKLLRDKNDELQQKVAELTTRKEKIKALLQTLIAKSVEAKYGHR